MYTIENCTGYYTVVLMEYIFIRAKKAVITENNNGLNNGMKNSKEKKIQCKKMAFWRGSNELVYLFKKI